ncbi:hypothetical protein RFI_20153 [Reticulomyxa filosa]|uniref:Uncharacterized protein n=1 Tax=Reticulomyxa filosa TaxID=46433 RepID=X6MTK1_RETFI|nr:hypothetical protein RFI_20153 [Reticulomyxa filosa]|eukprot:ETO17179.1 hypothetical protein RFI_20153 [Reticulomyxa filosa]
MTLTNTNANTSATAIASTNANATSKTKMICCFSWIRASVKESISSSINNYFKFFQRWDFDRFLTVQYDREQKKITVKKISTDSVPIDNALSKHLEKDKSQTNAMEVDETFNNKSHIPTNDNKIISTQIFKVCKVLPHSIDVYFCSILSHFYHTKAKSYYNFFSPLFMLEKEQSEA